jgi:predicted metal-dependent hydrolase
MFCGRIEKVDREPFLHGLELFNRGEFYDAHEVWEDVWRAAPAPEKKFLQGLIQVAVALHHHSKGNLVGARSLLERGRNNLSACDGTFTGIDIAALLGSLSACGTALASDVPLATTPKLATR